MRKILVILLIFGFFSLGCVSTTEDGIVCNDPYIRMGDGCCLDTNDNGICDTDEPAEETPCEGSGADYCSEDIRYYDAVCQDGEWVYESEHCPFGCESGICKAESCPSDCDDGNPCTRDYCSSSTGFSCAHDSLNGAQSGCSGSAGTCLEYTCSDGSCISQSYTPCCGNGECESTETYITCLEDCPAPAPKLDIVIMGCDTGYDISHGLGEVTNVYAEIRNIGNADASGVTAEASASDEDSGVHPNKQAPIGDIPAGYAARVKMTVDTAYRAYGTISVRATAYNADSTIKSTNDCSEIDPNTIEGLGTIVKLYTGGLG